MGAGAAGDAMWDADVSRTISSTAVPLRWRGFPGATYKLAFLVSAAFGFVGAASEYAGQAVRAVGRGDGGAETKTGPVIGEGGWLAAKGMVGRVIGLDVGVGKGAPTGWLFGGGGWVAAR